MFKWILVFLIGAVAYQAREVFPPFIIAVVLAYLLNPAVTFLCRRVGMSRMVAVLSIYLVGLGGLGFAVWRGLPLVASEAVSLFAHRHQIVLDLVRQVAVLSHGSINAEQVSAAILDKFQAFVIAKPEEFLLAIGGQLSHSLLSIVICFVSSIYFVYDGHRVMQFFLRFVPEQSRDRFSQVLDEINAKFRRYVAGQALLMGIMAVLSFIILSLFHVKYALVIALVTGVLEVLPVIGPLIAILLGTLIAASQLGLIGAAGVALCLYGARMIEDYLVIPRVIGHAVQLHPLATIVAVLVGQNVFGALGMLLAVPMAAAAKVIIDINYPAPIEAAVTAKGTVGPATATRWKAAFQRLVALASALLGPRKH